eukprot:CAMPEP_0180693774 /NCGR_PEP_ID=MMETSP1038_2-20121128/1544_1 /TAXON_ID=632150 /ORGANISM="Azadinium spinosum, Strain 3D9" /LENGTH=282 /DNA_ID=CAMNT_0022725047 /DNA_START=144 /DNA_END=990 /DNA_ORIENTATION=+
MATAYRQRLGAPSELRALLASASRAQSPTGTASVCITGISGQQTDGSPRRPSETEGGRLRPSELMSGPPLCAEKAFDVFVLGGASEGRLLALEAADHGASVALLEPVPPGRRAAFDSALRCSLLPSAALGAAVDWDRVSAACETEEERFRHLSAALQDRHVSLLHGEAQFLQLLKDEGRVVRIAVSNAHGKAVHCLAGRVEIAVTDSKPEVGTVWQEAGVEELQGLEHCLHPEDLAHLAARLRDQGGTLGRVAVLGVGARAVEICTLCEAAGSKPIWVLGKP